MEKPEVIARLKRMVQEFEGKADEAGTFSADKMWRLRAEACAEAARLIEDAARR